METPVSQQKWEAGGLKPRKKKKPATPNGGAGGSLKTLRLGSSRLLKDRMLQPQGYLVEGIG